jgi:phage gp46-like protein
MTFRPYKRPTGYNFDGEPRLIPTGNGTTIELHGGQPVMDAGVENAVLISLFTRPGWWGNQYLDTDFRVGDSTFDEVTQGAITRSTFVTAENEAKRALAWMVDDGIASTIDATVANREGLGIDAEVTINRPSGTTEEIALRHYGENWIRQGEDPASARLREDY